MNIRVCKENARVLMDAFERIGIWYCGGRNSPYIWLKCPDDTKEAADRLCKLLRR